MCRAKNDVMIYGKDNPLEPGARFPEWEYWIGVRVSSEGLIYPDPSPKKHVMLLRLLLFHLFNMLSTNNGVNQGRS